MDQRQKESFLHRKVTSWISITVLTGCVLITVMLVYSAMKADVLGAKLSLPSNIDSIKGIKF